MRRLRYLESFDSVRFSKADPLGRTPPVDERRVQAQMGLALSMLFGDPIVLPRPYSFDSSGFLEIASDVLAARKGMKRRWEGHPLQSPFVLALPSPDGTSAIPAEQKFRTVAAHGFASEMHLSGWADLQEDRRKRAGLAKALERDGDRQMLRREGRGCLRDPVLEERFEQLLDVDDYFNRSPRLRYTVAGYSPDALLDLIHDVRTPSGFEPQSPRERRRAALSAAFDAIEAAGLQPDNRTVLRQPQIRDHVSDDTLPLLLEYHDSCYNAVLASMTRAHSAMLSTTEDPGLESTEDIDLLARENAEESLGGATEGVAEMTIDMVEPPTARLGLDRMSWSEIWRIVTDGDWERSIRSLHDALDRGKLEGEDGVDRALESHVKLVADCLPAPPHRGLVNVAVMITIHVIVGKLFHGLADSVDAIKEVEEGGPWPLVFSYIDDGLGLGLAHKGVKLLDRGRLAARENALWQTVEARTAINRT